MSDHSNSDKWLDAPPLEVIQAEIDRRARNKINDFYPDEGPLRRELYQTHLAFFRAGQERRERLVLAGNRCGKTVIGSYETTVHVTGLYPPWWEGRRFETPIKAWACGEHAKKVREVVQEYLLGQPGQYGTGMIPGDTIIRMTPKSGIPDAIDTVYIHHVSGGTSTLVFKSYEQGREAFDGDAVHSIWLDEECPMEIYTECVIRTMTTSGIVMCTFTPLHGMTELIRSFMCPESSQEWN